MHKRIAIFGQQNGLESSVLLTYAQFKLAITMFFYIIGQWLQKDAKKALKRQLSSHIIIACFEVCLNSRLESELLQQH